MSEHGDQAAAAADTEPGLFEGLLVMLAATAMESLGDSPGPAEGEPRVNLQQVRQMIDLLGVLQEKTRGNLTS
jgi:hypothetical protein